MGVLTAQDRYAVDLAWDQLMRSVFGHNPFTWKLSGLIEQGTDTNPTFGNVTALSLVTNGGGTEITTGADASIGGHLLVGSYIIAHSNIESDNGVFQASGAASTAAALVGYANDGASAVATILDNNVALTNATAKLVSIRNLGVEKAYFGVSGIAHLPGAVVTGPTSGQVGVSIPSDVWLDLDGAAIGGSPNVGIRWNSGQSAIQVQQSVIGPSAGGVDLGSATVPFGHLYVNNVALGAAGLTNIINGPTSGTSGTPGGSVEFQGGTGWATDGTAAGTAGGGVILQGGTGGAGDATHASGVGVGITIQGGNAGAANGGAGNSSGDIFIDVGSATGSGTNGDIDIGTVRATGVHLGRGSAGPVYADGDLRVATKVTSFGGIATSGQGVAPIRTWGSLLGNTGNNNAVCQFIPPLTAGIYEIGGWFKCTAWTSGTIGMQFSYTDVEGVAQNDLMAGTHVGTSSVSLGLTGTGVIQFFNQTIFVDASGGAITLATVNTGTATGDYAAWIKQVL